MKVGLALAAALVLLAIALAARAPATLLDARVAAATADRVRVAEASGTVWNGAGDLVLLPKGTRRAITWHIDAWPLLAGDVRGSVAIDRGESRADFAYGPQHMEVRRLDLSLPVDSVLQSAGVSLIGAAGTLAAHVERFVRTPQALDADLALDWLDASLPSLRPGLRIALGDVRLEIKGNGAEASGPLSNRGGDVEIGGRVALTAALVPRIEATVRPRAGLERDRADAVAAALSMLGSPDGQGGYRLTWSGS